MRIFSIGVCAAATFALLWLGDLSSVGTEAAQLRRVGRRRTDTRNPYGVPGFTFERTHGFSKGQTAKGTYRGKPAFLKCTKNKALFENECFALLTIQSGNPKEFNMDNNVKSSFASILSAVQPRPSKYCMVFGWLDGVGLHDYVRELEPYQKEELLPVIFLQVIKALQYMHALKLVHGDIKPDNIIITQPTPNGPPKAVLIDFDMSQKVERTRAHAVGGTPGYMPPEDYLEIPTDQYKRDSWMLGATIYEGYTNMPPYGVDYDEASGKYIEWTDKELRDEMRSISSADKNTYEKVEAKSRSLVDIMDKLMTCDLEKRPTVSSLSARLVAGLSEHKKVYTYLAQLWTKLASKRRR
ncbi:kinase-like domain-containing protein [Thamnocephalis sphaerospora]|uniref:non-specific serine/threonine protein kinase n=1 Tax=Thamnocephalis sphaerospora TaxID=78915 RepID=A0A4P9XUL4_9FUNG|nr:kinase-like domain-containing protein [Thamnocephalis sphaerospora]|eukprot:RKP09906.1 kinase-like domain-containing protein [Thamnocephalis sphaerospora]